MNSNDYRDVIVKILGNSTIDCIYIIGYHNDLILLTRQIREYNRTIPLYASSNFETDELLKSLGTLANNVIYGTSSIENKDSNYLEFENLYTKKYGKKPTVFTINSYDIVKILWSSIVINNYNISDVQKIADTIKKKEFQGISGKIKFMPNGEVLKPIAIKTIIDGKVNEISVYNPLNELH